ncbi:MAG TPA: hypothetical protein VJC16_02550 [Candidatus Nanoarchaeia archaeon]|nr:hypothetical protein [Candidatus Nanoarchaeia archaeon]
MIAVIPFISNDYLLALAYVGIIAVAFAVSYERKDGLIFLFGLIMMALVEYLFIRTGVEIFLRNSLFGVMPVWLPLLWAYAFVAIRRAINVMERD